MYRLNWKLPLITMRDWRYRLFCPAPNRFDLLNILIPIEGGEEGELIRKIRRVHPTFYILDSKLIDEFVRWWFINTDCTAITRLTVWFPLLYISRYYVSGCWWWWFISKVSWIPLTPQLWSVISYLQFLTAINHHGRGAGQGTDLSRINAMNAQMYWRDIRSFMILTINMECWLRLY